MYNNVVVKSYGDIKQYHFYTSRPKKLKSSKTKRKNIVSVNSLKEASNRAKTVVFDLARCNSFNYFITLTFNPDIVDSFSYSECTSKLENFTKYLRRHNCEYLIVPEQHQSGRFHFHGLVKGDLPLSPSGLNFKGNPIYNLVGYNLGFSTATKILDNSKVSSYITKYLTKCLTVPVGKKRYWASRSLNRPIVETVKISNEQCSELLILLEQSSTFHKFIVNDYGTFEIYESKI